MSVIIHEPGIYFNLAGAEYHHDESLGSTSLKEITLSPCQWQYKRLHGEVKDTAALMWGNALHARCLDGKDVFERDYRIAPEKSDYPGCLITVDDLKEYAGQIGVRGGKKKDDWIQLIRSADPVVPIWDEIVDQFAKSAGNAKIITRKIQGEIETAVTYMQADPYLDPVMKDGTIVGGSPEVSIFYERDGVRLKARLDHMMPHAIIDLKSFRVARMERAPTAARRAIARERYDLQAASYIMALEAAEELYKNGHVFGAGEFEYKLLDRVFLNYEKFSKRKMRDDGMEYFRWVWVCVRNSDAPEPVVDELNMRSMMFGAARQSIDSAIEIYVQYTKEFGADKDWPPRHPVEILGDESFPSWAFM